jgi:2-methylcitrate dehydratase PrpD
VEKLTHTLAEWSSSLRAVDVPENARRRAGWQWASVLGAVAAVEDHPRSVALGAVARRGSAGGPATLLPEGEPASTEAAVWANAARSVLLDFDDYLFAAHTGHSAVLVTLALGEELDAPGPELLAATVAANEAGGRLGAAMLTGPHNGQMWAYVHNLAGAVAAARLLGLDAERTAHAIGLALTQPPYPLPATFMGSDGKALTASGPAVEGLRAALLAAEGFRCEVDVLGDRSGFFARVHPGALAGMFSGFGEAWLTESLSYKVYPGCAYLDTAVDALDELASRLRDERGRPLVPEEVAAVRVFGGPLTLGMEAMSSWYRRPGGGLGEVNKDFSVPYSLALYLLAGRLTAAEFHPDWWGEKAAELEALAARIHLEQDQDLVGLMRQPVGPDVAALVASGKDAPVLAGTRFDRYESRFPARVELELADGTRLAETVVVPRGAAGRPAAETREAVHAKLLAAGAREGAFEALESLETLRSAREVAPLVLSRARRGPAPAGARGPARR